MAIDLNKYGSEMLKAFNDVISGKNNTDWALYGYEGQTNVLKLIGTGDGGLEELADDLSSSRIMYAILRVTDPKTTRQKVVLINWQGEGAPSLRKGTSASHLPALHTFFKGIHVTVSARTEDEVELSTVMAAVQKASATEYDFAQRTDDVNERTAPVGTNYKRTNPLAEIDSNRRNKFWEQMEAAETERKEEELRRRELEHKAEEAERKKREIASTHEREVRTKERNARIVAEHKAESEAELRLIAASTRVRKDSDLHNGAREVDDDEAERAQRAEKLRAERKKEAEALAGHRAHEARALFEGGGGRSPNSAWKQEDVRVGVSSGSGRPPSKVLKEFSPISNRSDVTNYSSNNSSPSITPGKMSSRWPPGGASISPVPAEVASGRAQQRGSAFGTSGQVRELSGSTFGTPNQVIPQHSSPPPPPLKQHRDSDITSDGMKNTIGHIRNILNDSDKHNNTNESNFHSGNETTELQSVKQNGLKNGQKTSYSNITIQDTANCVVEQVLSQVSSQVSSSQVLSRTKKTELVTSNSVQDQGLGLAVEAVTCEVDGIEYQILPEHGLCARAVYDYQAADDTEITFNPSEIITNIDQIDEGWWQGLGPDGNYGLFPANYVELINPAVLL